MSENVYDNPIYPDLAMEVRHGREEMEERGEREERVVDIYVSTDDLDPGTQQHAVQRNTAQEQCGDSNETKKNRSREVGLFLVLLCALLLAVIVGVVIYYSELIKEKNNILAKERDELQSSFDHLESRLNNLTEEKEQSSSDQLATIYSKLDEQKNLLQSTLIKLETKYNNLTEKKEREKQLKSMFDQLETRYNNLTEERVDLKKIMYVLSGWKTFGSGLYYISKGKTNWQHSRQWCRNRNSDLMVINSNEKQDFVVSLNQRVWLGLTDIDREGHWKWVNETPLTEPRYWRPNQPNNNGGRDCVEFIPQPARAARGWNVRSCGGSSPIKWVCERIIN